MRNKTGKQLKCLIYMDKLSVKEHEDPFKG